MPNGDKVGLAFLGFLFVGAAALLLFPQFREGEAQAGLSGALNLPLWVLSVLMMAVSVLAAALIVRYHRRR